MPCGKGLAKQNQANMAASHGVEVFYSRDDRQIFFLKEFQYLHRIYYFELLSKNDFETAQPLRVVRLSLLA